MVMEEVMMVMQKVEENQKRKRNPTCYDRSRYCQHNLVIVVTLQPCQLCSQSTQHALLQTTQL